MGFPPAAVFRRTVPFKPYPSVNCYTLGFMVADVPAFWNILEPPPPWDPLSPEGGAATFKAALDGDCIDSACCDSA
jgi:hypothetical protein